VTAPSRREVVLNLTEPGLLERHALQVVRMSASSLCYQPVPDWNGVLREKHRDACTPLSALRGRHNLSQAPSAEGDQSTTDWHGPCVQA
jgi:hypothetical protein